MGLGADDGPPTDAAGRLVAEVNRFTAKKLYGSTIYPVATGTVPAGAAATAAVIYQTRLIVAQAGIVDPGTAAQLAAVNAAMASGKTVAWVMANLATVTDALKGYADSQGLPYLAGQGTSSGVSSIYLIAAVGIAAYLLLRKKKGGP